MDKEILKQEIMKLLDKWFPTKENLNKHTCIGLNGCRNIVCATLKDELANAIIERNLIEDNDIYNALNEWFPAEPEIRGCCCQALRGCRDLSCPNLKLAMARMLSKKLKELK